MPVREDIESLLRWTFYKSRVNPTTVKGFDRENEHPVQRVDEAQHSEPDPEADLPQYAQEERCSVLFMRFVDFSFFRKSVYAN
jgi:hypothetical protein